jgi:hypothetical protein
MRELPLRVRKNNLARLLRRRVDGIQGRHSSMARSARTYSGRPATCGWKASSLNIAIGPTAPARASTGSR